jgi:hypothetical protein
VRRYLVMVVAAALLLSACKSTSNSTNTSASTAITAAPVTDTRAPGVTSNSIQVGIVYVDLKSIASIVHINQGDFPKAYQAIIDDINSRGGIHGRKLVATIVGVNPTIQSSADSACTKLTQDTKVFVALGFFLNDNVLCYVDTNQTATIGGPQTAARLAKAKAPWYSTDAGETLEANVAKTLAEKGKLGGKVAVVAVGADEALLKNQVEPALDKAGIKPVATAILSAPTNDAAATYAQAQTIAQRFQSAGATKILLVGQAISGSFLPGLAKTSYRPQLLFTSLTGAGAYTSGKGNDLSLLKNSIAGGVYGPGDAILSLPDPTASCMEVQRKAGLVIKPPTQVTYPDPNQFVSSNQACQQMALLTAILLKAGPTLNYGTFAAAGNSLGKIVLPGAPGPWNFGAPPNADGNPQIYPFVWNSSTAQFEIIKS